MTTYCIITSSTFASRAEVQAFLDEEPGVTDWYACFPNCVFVWASVSADELARQLGQRFGTGPGRLFLVTEIGSDRQGRLPKELWQAINGRAPSEQPAGAEGR